MKKPILLLTALTSIIAMTSGLAYAATPTATISIDN